MLRLKFFVRVQTFRRRPFVPPHKFCHPGYNYILPAKVKQSWSQSPGQRIRDACRKSCVSPHCYLDWCKDIRIRAFWTLHILHKFLIYLFQFSLGGSQYHLRHRTSVNFKFCNIWPIECFARGCGAFDGQVDPRASFDQVAKLDQAEKLVDLKFKWNSQGERGQICGGARQ